MNISKHFLYERALCNLVPQQVVQLNVSIVLKKIRGIVATRQVKLCARFMLGSY